MAKFRGKISEIVIHTGDSPYVVEPAPGGLWSTITLFFVTGTAVKWEVEGTLDGVEAKLAADRQNKPQPFLA
jgi:hypothetical protein